MKRKRRGERRSPGPGRGRGSSPPGRLQPPLLIVADTGRTAAPGLKTGMKQERRRPENALPALPYGSGATFPASVIADQVAREPGCVCATVVVPAAPEWLAHDSGEVAAGATSPQARRGSVYASLQMPRQACREFGRGHPAALPIWSVSCSI